MKITAKIRESLRELGRMARRDEMSAENCRIFFGAWGIEGYFSVDKLKGEPEDICFPKERKP
jgi:hypothetical protein